MALTDLVRSLPVSRDLIRSAATALQPASRRSSTTVTVPIAMLGLGVVLGAGVALLCARQTGRELRRQISNRPEGGARTEDADESSRAETLFEGRNTNNILSSGEATAARP